jgi:hypothetical protein
LKSRDLAFSELVPDLEYLALEKALEGVEM